MIEEQAVVIRVDQDQAYLEIVRRSPCGLCGQTRGCGISLWGRLFGHRQSMFQASNGIAARAGDNVVVGVEEKALLASSLAVYGMPLLALLAGTALGTGLAPAAAARDLYSVLGAVAGLLLGLLWLKGHAAGRGMDARYRPVILRHAEDCSRKNVCQS
ncbi:MAG: Fis family transcriptional regulator [Nitrosomonadales bacterium]|jgi:sigma-E factor negative regulatory protein RseC|nr:MAG: Fis family transcriptional regulator [Nitrosomonadales bacterium]